MSYYPLSEEEATNLVRVIKIFHPYGSVGSLPCFKNSSSMMKFGAEPSPKQLLKQSYQIKTFTEGTDPESSEIKSIRARIEMANKLVFLGFGFNKQNMELLNPENTGYNKRVKCFASTFGISKSDETVIDSQITALYNREVYDSRMFNQWADIQMSNLKCADFFGEYSKSLAF